MTAGPAITKHQIACPVCLIATYKVRFTDELGDRPAPVDYNFGPDTQKVYQIVTCDGCGFVYTNPVPDLGPAYADTVDEVYLESIEQRRMTARNDVQIVKEFVPDGRLLDVGCNIGVFLDAARDGGFDVEGIELSRWSREQAANNGHIVYGNTLEELGFAAKYDAVTLWGVIEHLQDPRAVMKQIHQALKPGGYLFIYTGDVSSILAKIMGRRWYWFMGMHLMYFSGTTLKSLLAPLGFGSFSCRIHTSYFSLASLAVSMKRYKVLWPIAWLLQRKMLASKFVGVTIPGEMLMIARKTPR